MFLTNTSFDFINNSFDAIYLQIYIYKLYLVQHFYFIAKQNGGT